MHKSLLTPPVLERREKNRIKVARCARGWSMYRRLVETGAGRMVETMARVWACGMRSCSRCAGSAWRRARSRMLAPDAAGDRVDWKTFVTLTFSRERAPMEAWRGIGKYMRQFVRALRERIWWLSPARGPRGGLVRVDPMAYAWVIEPHPTAMSWPHVHMVLDFTLEGTEDRRRFREWAKDWWRAITDRDVRWIVFEDVECQERAAHYLTKYLTKSEWNETLLAVMYRRRRFGTSRRAQPKSVGGWRKGEDMTWDQVRAWWAVIQAESRASVQVDRPGLLIVTRSAEWWGVLLLPHPEVPYGATEPRDIAAIDPPQEPVRRLPRWHFDPIRAAATEAALAARCAHTN